MKIVIDISSDRMKSYGMMYRTFASDDDLPNDFDEVIERAKGIEEIELDLSVLGKDDAKQIEFGLAMMVFGTIGLEGKK